MKKIQNILVSGLVVTMVVSLAACGAGAEAEPAAPAEEEAVEETEVTVKIEDREDTLVYAISEIEHNFCPFFATTEADLEIVRLLNSDLLVTDRNGVVVENGIEGETREYRGTEYNYNGIATVDVKRNYGGTVDYDITIRDDIVFSDGEKANIDDVIFSMYVLADPTYDGAYSFSELPIEGIEEYRECMKPLMQVIMDDGRDGYIENDNYTKEQYDRFWMAFDSAGSAFCQEIVDWLMTSKYNSKKSTVAQCAINWGYELPEDATTLDFFNAMVDIYGYNLSDTGINNETAGTSIKELLLNALGSAADTYMTGVPTDYNAEYISGIKRTGDYSVRIKMTEYDPNSIYSLAIPVAPLHYYGDSAQYNVYRNMFGFTKGDLAGIRAKSEDPVGSGPYVFSSYKDGTVTLKANENYYGNAPQVSTLIFEKGKESDFIPGIVLGTYDIATVSMTTKKLDSIYAANSNHALSGDVLTSYMYDANGYGYIGINARLVNINDDPDSDASKALRKGFMTLFAVYREAAIDDYYGEMASVLEYPISNTSWAAPLETDEGYLEAYSVDSDGELIYTPFMSDEARLEAAKKAAIGYFEEAGYEYDETSGKFLDMTEEFEIIIPGLGVGNHPAYDIAAAASAVLEELGITLTINDVKTDTWNSAIESHTAQMWAGAWKTSVDPDMSDVYHSSNAYGEGTTLNYFDIDDPKLDELIVDGLNRTNQSYRKVVYKDAMDIVMDWGVILPVYQSKECVVVSTKRVITNSLPDDITPYYGWDSEISSVRIR